MNIASINDSRGMTGWDEETRKNVPLSTQKLIEKLIEELDRKSEAIQKIGEDCLVLRKHASSQENEIALLKQKLEDSDLKTKRLIQSFDLDIIPPDELRRRYALLAAKLEKAMTKLDQLERLRDVDLEREKVEKENIALRQAHTAQQALVLDLQETVQKSQKFKAVIQKQEEVISKLEMSLRDAMDQLEQKRVETGYLPSPAISNPSPLPRPEPKPEPKIEPTVYQSQPSLINPRREKELEDRIDSLIRENKDMRDRIEVLQKPKLKGEENVSHDSLIFIDGNVSVVDAL
jgi:hypothetical protein